MNPKQEKAAAEIEARCTQPADAIWMASEQLTRIQTTRAIEDEEVAAYVQAVALRLHVALKMMNDTREAFLRRQVSAWEATLPKRGATAA